MAIAFIEGWDKYGNGDAHPAVSAALPAAASSGPKFLALAANEWTTINAGAGTTMGLCQALSNTGWALEFAGALTAPNWQKTLAGNYTKAVGGICMNYVSFGAGSQQIIQFKDGTTLQAAIGVDNLGHVTVYSKTSAVIGTSSSVNTANTVHYVEWEIQVGNASGTYKVWVDGVLVINGTGGAFNGTANAYYNNFILGPTGGIGGVVIAFDHLYIDDGTGAVLNTNPVVETHVTTSDSAVQFTNSAYALGTSANTTTFSTDAPGVVLFLRKFTPAVNMTLNSVSIIPNATSGAAKFKAVLYADSAGSPAALTATGTETIGTTAGVVFTGPFAAGQSLTGGTAYWIGFITDTSVVLLESDIGTTGWAKTNTYASGPPNPAGVATSTVRANWILWGNCTGVGVNYLNDANLPSFGLWGDYNYVSDNTVGHEDLMGVAALTANPSVIHTVAVKAFVRDSDAGARTVTLNQKLTGTDTAGSNAGFSPTTTFGWFTSFWTLDPTGATWNVSNLNSTTAGYKITA